MLTIDRFSGTVFAASEFAQGDDVYLTSAFLSNLEHNEG
jgi:hypothetical protein